MVAPCIRTDGFIGPCIPTLAAKHRAGLTTSRRAFTGVSERRPDCATEVTSALAK